MNIRGYTCLYATDSYLIIPGIPAAVDIPAPTKTRIFSIWFNRVKNSSKRPVGQLVKIKGTLSINKWFYFNLMLTRWRSQPIKKGVRTSGIQGVGTKIINLKTKFIALFQNKVPLMILIIFHVRFDLFSIVLIHR